jgi:hypothetical protein
MDHFNLQEEFQKKLVDTPRGPRCICDMCGRKGKIGAFSFDTFSAKPLVICYRCDLQVIAERDGISVKEAERRRKRRFAVQDLFQEMKMAQYFASKNIERFDSLEEANRVLDRITTAWNSLTTEERKSFDEKDDKELHKIYKKIEVDFSGL